MPRKPIMPARRGRPRRVRIGSALVAAGLMGLVALAPAPPARAEDVWHLIHPTRPILDEPDFYSASDFGGVGLLETRTARFGPDGLFDVSGSFVGVYRRYSLNWHILPWLEATFRYTDIRNRLFSQNPAFSSNQTRKDRGADLKILLADEGPFSPALALGLQDGLGTGLFSGEFLVANKRWYDFDFSAGLGWGYFAGSKGTFRNPLRALSSRFDARPRAASGGGRANFGQYFSGPDVGVFGGVQWRTPIQSLTVKLEYEANDYQAEPLGNRFNQDLPINFGLVWRPYSWLDLAGAFERGNTLAFRVSLRSRLNGEGVAKLEQPPPLPPRPKAGDLIQAAPAEAAALRAGAVAAARGRARVDLLFDGVEAAGFTVRAVESDDQEARIFVDATSPLPAASVERAAGAVVDALPQPVERVVLIGSDGRRVTVPRSRIEQAAIIDRLFDGLAAAGLEIDRVDLNHDEARIFVAGRLDRLDLTTRRKAARLVLDAAPTPIQKVTFVSTLQRGVATSITRADTRQGTVVDELFDGLKKRGFEIERIEISRSRATVTVTAAPWVAPKDYQDAASMVADLSNADLSLVTVVAMRAGYEQARVTFRRVPDGSLQPAPASDTASGITAPAPELSTEVKAAVAKRVFAELAAGGLAADGLYLDARRAVVYVTPKRFLAPAQNIGRAARIVARNAPASVEAITVVTMNAGMELSRVTIYRGDLERAVTFKGSPEEIWANRVVTPGQGGLALPDGVIPDPARYPALSFGVSPRFRQTIGGPESFLLYQLYLGIESQIELRRGLRVGALGAINITDTFDKLENPSNSELPKVRSNISEYLRRGKNGLRQLYAEYAFSPYPEWYGKLTGGLLEEMYGGVAAEVLYRPMGKRYAFGLEIARVQQRAFNVLFDFRDFGQTTGHASLYYQLPVYDLNLQVDAGRYLAGDNGATVTLSRHFRSGIETGFFFTLTDVPFSKFGEGSFDKGFFFRIPLDVLLPTSTRQKGVFLFRPLTRDGGQRVFVPNRLYGLTADANSKAIDRSWQKLLD